MDQLFQLYQKYAPDEKAAKAVWSHTTLVLKIAEQLVKKNNLEVNWEIAKPGILLHDIATFECEERYNPVVVKPYIQHALLGSLITRAEGFDETVSLMVERHIGLGISKDEIIANNYPLPKRDFLPETLEEKLLSYADKFHSKGRGFRSFEERVEQYKQYGDGPVKRLQIFRDQFGIPSFEEL